MEHGSQPIKDNATALRVAISTVAAVLNDSRMLDQQKDTAKD